MKNLMFLLFITLSACNKDEFNISDTHPGIATAKKNGVNWQANVRSGPNVPIDFGIFLDFSHYNESGFLRSYSDFYKIPFAEGKYILTNSDIRAEDSIPGAWFGTAQDGGDAGGDGYDILTADNIEDYIEITRIEGNDIYGTFQVSFAKHLRIPEEDHTSPDTIVFTEGIFHAKYVE